MPMNYFDKVVDYSLRHVFEPGLGFALSHPIVAVVVVAVLIYWAVRGYRML
jgi:hypothetical protein